MTVKLRKFTALGAIALIATWTLAACAPEPGVPDKSSDNKVTNETKPNRESQNSAEQSTPSPDQTSLTSTLQSEPINLSCESVFPLAELYAFDPNLALVAESPSISSAVVEKQQSLSNIFCNLIHTTTGEKVQYGVVRLTRESASSQSKKIGAASQAEVFQATVTTKGQFLAPTAQFVEGLYWISVSSSDFRSGRDAAMWSGLIAENLN